MLNPFKKPPGINAEKQRQEREASEAKERQEREEQKRRDQKKRPGDNPVWIIDAKPVPASSAALPQQKPMIKLDGIEKNLPVLSQNQEKLRKEQEERERLAAENEALRAQLAEVKKAPSEPLLHSSKNSEKVKIATTSSGMKDPELVNTENFSSKVTYIPEGKVKLEEELGRGGFGTVYKGQYNFQTVAVKRYEGARLPARQEAEILHEVGIMLRLQHECLVRLLGLVQIDSHPAMVVMEYGANGSLYAYLQSKGEIPWGLRLRLAEELARGIAYLHQERIVHRDIKSLNVVLDRDLHAKWCDFGLAVLKLHTTTTTKQENTNAVGTLRWMAPELFSRKTSSPSTASDIWALGMVFFELASRDVPFKDAQSQAQVQTWIMTGEGEDIPEDCKNQSPAFGTLMQRCWSERNTRPSAPEIVDEITQIHRSLVDTPVTVFQKAAASSSTTVDSGYMDFSRPNKKFSLR